MTAVNLHVSHSWGGGVARWIDDFARADDTSGNLVLESTGFVDCFGIGLQLRDPNRSLILDARVLESPISEIAIAHEEWRRYVARIVERFGVDHVYLSSLVGHSLDVFGLGVPLTQVHHDYHPWCPAFFATLASACRSCTHHDLERCRHGRGHRPRSSALYYLRVRERYFAALAEEETTHVVPTDGVGARLRQLDTRFAGVRFHVVPHGIDIRRHSCFAATPSGKRLQVGLLGNLGWYRGAERFRRLFERLRLVADFRLLGCQEHGEEYRGRWGVAVVRSYAHRDLVRLLAGHPLDLALFVPEVPETFSYLLSETRALGIPPLARSLGAFAERITDGADGILFGSGDDELVDALLDLADDRERLARIAATLMGTPVHGVDEMVAGYHALRTAARSAAIL